MTEFPLLAALERARAPYLARLAAAPGTPPSQRRRWPERMVLVDAEREYVRHLREVQRESVVEVARARLIAEVQAAIAAEDAALAEHKAREYAATWHERWDL